MTPKTLALVLGFVAAGTACSSNNDTPNETHIGGVNSAGGGGSGTSGTSGGGVPFMVGTGGTVTGPPPDACQATDVAKEALPVDMYIMFDQSSSMNAQVPNANPPATWWQTAQSAVAQFVQDPRASGIGVGIQFFPYKGSIAGPDPNVASSSCYIPNYVTPEVEIGLLPGNTAALQQAIQNHAPTTFTPTAAALQGAIQHMQAWGPAHAGRQPVVVLVTDGFPTECNPQDPSLIAQIAKQAFEGTPRVMTFVVGFQTGEALDNLGQIAKAGGTGEAFLIKGGNIGDQFVQAMLGISTTPIDCTFDIPVPTNPDEKLDLNQIWVEYVSAATHIPMPIPQLDNAGQCQSAADGWYLDAPPPTSKKIIICPQTCQKFAAGSMHIKYGCKQGTGPMH
jgi:hypothetical protein